MGGPVLIVGERARLKDVNVFEMFPSANHTLLWGVWDCLHVNHSIVEGHLEPCHTTVFASNYQISVSVVYPIQRVLESNNSQIYVPIVHLIQRFLESKQQQEQ